MRAEVVLHRLGALAGERHEIHLEFGVVGAPGILRQLRPADTLRHGSDPRILPERLGHLAPRAARDSSSDVPGTADMWMR